MSIIRIIIPVLSLLALLGCNKAFEQAMKGTDTEKIIKLAEMYHSQGKYRQTSELLRHVTPMVLGTKLSQKVLYMAAQNSFDDKNYLLSATRFKNFAQNNPSDSLAERAWFMAAKSYYLNSPPYNLDQADTDEAIKLIQDYINRYPNAEHVAEANTYIVELRNKLDRKGYENALSYYKTGRYKSAIVALQSFIEDYSYSKYRQEAYINLLRARHEVAVNSIPEKKRSRLLEANTVYKRLSQLYPQSKYLEEAKKLNSDILKELKTYN